jgi:signal peptidase I
MRKFHVGDLVTVVKNDVWYTHLNDGLRNTLIGKTGRVIDIDEITFNADDKRGSHPFPSEGYLSVPDDYSETIYECRVKFPFMPERPIVFAEAHLKEFNMES